VVQVGKRLEIIDVFRGIAVLGFIIWHAFDLFYLGDKFEQPLFRAVILTRVSFVSVSAMVMGLRSWTNYKISDHLKRSLKIIIYPVVIGVAKTIKLGNPRPIIDVLMYPINGGSDFTFSILIIIGLVYLFLPIMLKNKSLQGAVVAIALCISILELFHVIFLTEFWKFICVSIIFTYIGKLVAHYSEAKSIVIGIGFFIINVMVFLSVLLSVDIYWTVRNYALNQTFLLILAVSGLVFNYSIIFKDGVIDSFFKILGRNSFLIYLGHYLIYVMIGLILGYNKMSIVGILGTLSSCTLMLVFILKRYQQLTNKLNIFLFS
jgi:hypothetical protein